MRPSVRPTHPCLPRVSPAGSKVLGTLCSWAHQDRCSPYVHLSSVPSRPLESPPWLGGGALRVSPRLPECSKITWSSKHQVPRAAHRWGRVTTHAWPLPPSSLEYRCDSSILSSPLCLPGRTSPIASSRVQPQHLSRHGARWVHVLFPPGSPALGHVGSMTT